MTIAANLKSHYVDLDVSTGLEVIKDYDSFVSECEDKSEDIEQDFDNESTSYSFVDGSVIVWSGSEIRAYGSL